MSAIYARSLIHEATMVDIQTRPYKVRAGDATGAYPCGCHPRPMNPTGYFFLCDYHEGYEAGCEAIERSLGGEADR